MRKMQLHCTRMFIITARRSYASAVLEVVSVCLSHACFTTLWLIQRTYRRHFIPHFNYSKHAVENGLSK